MKYHEISINLKKIYDGNFPGIYILSSDSDYCRWSLLSQITNIQDTFYYQGRKDRDYLEIISFERGIYLPSIADMLDDYLTTKKERKIIIFDSISKFFAQNNLIIRQILNYYYDHLDQGLILIFSDTTYFVNNEILSEKYPIANDYTSFDLENYSYFDLKTQLKYNYTNDQLFFIYSITHGNYEYLKYFNKPLEEAMIDLLSDYQNIANNIEIKLSSLISEFTTYNHYLFLIANGISSLYDIHKHARDDKAKISTYLNKLMLNNILSRPIRGTYVFTDFFIHFYYRYLYSNQTILSYIDKKDFYHKYILTDIDSLYNLPFYSLCLTYLNHLAESNQLPFTPQNKSTSILSKKTKIDYFLTDGKNGLFANYYTSNIYVSFATYQAFRTDVEMVTTGKGFDMTTKYYYLFSKAGFTNELNRYSLVNDEVRLITFNQIINNS